MEGTSHRMMGVLNSQQKWLPPAFISLLCLDLLHRLSSRQESSFWTKSRSTLEGTSHRMIGVLNSQRKWLPPAFVSLLCLDLLHRDLVMHCTPQFHEALDFASRPRWTSREKRNGEQSWRDTAARTLISIYRLPLDFHSPYYTCRVVPREP